MKQVLNLLLVTALVAPLLMLSGCCKDESYTDKTGHSYSK